MASKHYTLLTADDFEELPGSTEDSKIGNSLGQPPNTPIDAGAASRMGMATENPGRQSPSTVNYAGAASRRPYHERMYLSQTPEDTKDRITKETDIIFDADDESSSEDPPIKTPTSDSNVSDSKPEAVQQILPYSKPPRHELSECGSTDFSDIPEDPRCPYPLKHLEPCFHSHFENIAVQSRSAVTRNEAIDRESAKSPGDPVTTHRPSTQSSRSPAIEWEDDTSGRRDSSARLDLAEPATPRPSVQGPESSQSPGSAVPPVEAHADEAASSQSSDGSAKPNAPTVSERKDDLSKPAGWKVNFWFVQLVVLVINLCTASGHAPFSGICEQYSLWATLLTVLPVIQLVSLFAYCSRKRSECTILFMGFLLMTCPLWLNSFVRTQQMCAHVDSSKWVAKDTVDAMVANATRDALANHTAITSSFGNDTHTAMNASSANAVTNITAVTAASAEDVIRLALEDVMRTINMTVDDVVRQLAESGNKRVFV